MDKEKKEKLVNLLWRNGIDIILGVVILLVVIIGAFMQGGITKANAESIGIVALVAVAYYAAKFLGKKNSMVEQTKEFRNKLYFNVENDMKTGHYDPELRYKQLKVHHKNMIIDDAEYRQLKARYDNDQKERKAHQQ